MSVTTTNPIKKTLAYPIKTKSDAFLISVFFSANPERISSLEKNIKTENNIIRYIILIRKPKKVAKKTRKQIKSGVEPKTYEPKAHQPIAGKVELKEIDQKIEEILK